MHYACANGAPVHVLKAMLEQHPTSAALADRSRGWLPLHYAVACACAAENAARSLKKAQQLARGRIHNRRRHAQTARRRHTQGELEQENTQNGEDQKDSGTLSEEATKRNDGQEVDEDLLADEKERSAQIQYYAEFAEVTAVNVLSALLEVYPDSVKEATGREGFLPLHLACEGQASLQVVALLLRAHRRGVRARGKRPVGTLPLSLALKSGSNMALRPKAAAHVTKTPHRTRGSRSSSRKRSGDDDSGSSSSSSSSSRENNVDRGRKNSIFAFCIATPLWPVVSLLLEAYPAAAKEVITKREGQYPIHVLSRLLGPVHLLRRVMRIDPGPVRKRSFHPSKEGGDEKGKRSISWRNDLPSSLRYIEALDGGDPSVEVDYRDKLMNWEAPFNKNPEFFG